ncbi:hypothetical protein HNR02_004020 [Amycolatopsis endophytica]|uniref:Uncharacterized protein n=1 Tax=Amycolatopsis endophytica TaxID=860233 RepID=A0A853B7H0_9PSEU|nr:hypothetical protein [Amycolatopsis endophytica]NYI90697.1 hypothetical protein [Amycolatopsis endophytica]
MIDTGGTQKGAGLLVTQEARANVHLDLVAKRSERTVTTLPASQPETRCPAGRHRGRSAGAVSVNELSQRVGQARTHAQPGRHRQDAADVRLGLVGVVVLTGWAATLRLLVLLAGPLVAVATVAPTTAMAATIPVLAGMAWLARPVSPIPTTS